MNKREDVLLVQFALTIVAKSPAVNAPNVVTAAKAVQITGTVDPAIVSVIIALQQAGKEQAPGTIVDGGVSPATAGYLYEHSGVWAIVRLNSLIQDVKMDIWPRIDKIPGCSVELKPMVIRTVVGS